MREMANSGSQEEKELLTHLSPKQALSQIGNLRKIVRRLREIDESLLEAFLWQIVVGGQVIVEIIPIDLSKF